MLIFQNKNTIILCLIKIKIPLFYVWFFCPFTVGPPFSGKKVVPWPELDPSKPSKTWRLANANEHHWHSQCLGSWKWGSLWADYRSSCWKAQVLLLAGMTDTCCWGLLASSYAADCGRRGSLEPQLKITGSDDLKHHDSGNDSGFDI